ncbi:MAG: hypothetical protein V4577_24340 [Bacteroidota bacterium]
MQTPQILLAVSAFSGLAGALLTQLITVLNNYLTDKRKERLERSASYRNKRGEIGENFYYMHGEVMAVIRKNISIWQNWNKTRSQASLDALNKEVVKFTSHLEKLYAENWKHNLVGLYFPVSFTAGEMMQANDISQKYRLSVLDMTAAIKGAAPEDRDALFEKYALIIFDMCAHYETVYKKMEQDRGIVKDELLADFSNCRYHRSYK